MPEPIVLPNIPFEQPAMDYALLRQEGIRLLERMTGSLWTDFNSHDPGITILEQICYALTDLANRINYTMPDLLTAAGSVTAASLPSPATILTQNPVTLTDLRKVAIDEIGVRNAWVEPAPAPDPARESALYYEANAKALRFLHRNDNSQEPMGLTYGEEIITLKGLYHVQIEPSDSDASDTRIKVAHRLHEGRGLGEDFAAIEALKQELIRVDATIEIATVENAATILHAIYQRLADFISPPVRFYPLSQRLSAGQRVDEIFEGPWLKQGFIDAAELQRAQRRTALRTSDLIREIMDIPGVRAVSMIRIASETGNWQAWSLNLNPRLAPRLAPLAADSALGSRITLQKNRLPISGTGAIGDKNTNPGVNPATGAAELPVAPRDLLPPTGRQRHVDNYYSLQQHFPALYGIGALGLGASADALRQAQAKQMKAYLLFFDQLLANTFAQLAHAGELFSFGGDPARTYFAQAFWQEKADMANPNASLGLDEIVAPLSAAEPSLNWLQRITERLTIDESAPPDYSRTNRFLNHLLARFGEQFSDYTLVLQETAGGQALPPAEKMIKDKQRFLQEYAQLGQTRGTAHNYLFPYSPSNRSGLERRIQRKLGLRDPEPTKPEENFYLVEHILLRPLAEESTPWEANAQLKPVIADLQANDPYSLQLSFVFPEALFGATDDNSKGFVARTLREETPAHLTFSLYWFDATAMTDFVAAYTDWQEQQRSYWCKKLRNPSASPSNQRLLRAARDRLIDLLSIGQTYPQLDLPVSAPPVIASNTPATITIANSQKHVLYELYHDELDHAAAPETPSAKGTGEVITLQTAPIQVDQTFSVRAQKLPWYLLSLDSSFVPLQLSSLELTEEEGNVDFRKILRLKRGLVFAEPITIKKLTSEEMADALHLLGLQAQYAALIPPNIAEVWQIEGGDKRLCAVKNPSGTLDLYQFPKLDGQETYLHTKTSVIEGIDTTLNARIDGDALIDYNTNVTVIIEPGQPGVTYQLVAVDQPGEQELSSPVSVETEGDIQLGSIAFTEDAVIGIRASRTAPTPSTKLLGVTLPLRVRANPDVEMKVGAEFIDYNQPATISIQHPQPGTTYKLYMRAIPDRDFKHPLEGETINFAEFIWQLGEQEWGDDPANDADLSDKFLVRKPHWRKPWVEPGGYRELTTLPVETDNSLQFTINELTEDSLIIVKATRHEESVQLQQVAVVLVRPNPEQRLTVTLVGGEWQVSDGQPGVFYYFSAQFIEGQTSIDLTSIPHVYFYKPDDENTALNKGVAADGQEVKDGLAIEVDFVVARSFPPLPPLLDRAQLPTDTDLGICAVKAQTRVATMLTQRLRL
jgi:hypothetical protein